MTHQSTPRYLTEKQVATITGFAVQTLRNWRHRGVGPVYCKVNNAAIRYPWGDLLSYMDQQKVGAAERGAAFTL